MKLSGGGFPKVWRGSYRYASKPGLPERGAVSFSMYPVVGAEGRFEGFIDEGAEGIPERASIKGSSDDGRIEFQKCYELCRSPAI